jgi:hypothetical protein
MIHMSKKTIISHPLYLGILLLFIAPIVAQSQVPDTLGPEPIATFFSSSGAVLANGYVCTFQAGTNTPQSTYTDSTGLIANPNPTVLNSAGRASIWFSASAYKIVVRDPGGDGTCGPSGGTIEFTTDNFQPSPFLNGNNSWTGNQTFSGTSVFNAAVTFAAGGAMSGSFSGSPTLTGNPTFSGSPNFTGSPSFSSASITWPTKLQPNLNANFLSYTLNNASITGTVANQLVKLTGAPSTGVVPLSTDTGGIIGICISNCGTTGAGTIQVAGNTPCQFDGAVTAGDYVQNSTTAGGECHDVGNSYPSSGQAIGRALATLASAGVEGIDLFPAEIRSPTVTVNYPNVVYSTQSGSTNTNVAATTMVTTGASNATYRFGFAISQTVVGSGCSGNTGITVSVIYQDPNAASPQTVGYGTVFVTTNGTLGQMTDYFGAMILRVKTATAIQYSVTYSIGSGCSPGPSYQLSPILEQLTAN